MGAPRETPCRDASETIHDFASAVVDALARSVFLLLHKEEGRCVKQVRPTMWTREKTCED